MSITTKDGSGFPIRIEQLQVLPQVLRWMLIASAVGGLAGSGSALFLDVLEWVTDYREGHRWIIALLPVAGFTMGLMYHRFGKSIEAGNNMIIDEIHEPKNTLPLRMTPLILLSTWGTHLFGGSAGREGTAVQMGASLADRLSGPLKLSASDRRILLMAGISAGFGSVFGTPIAGAIFGLEVLTMGRMSYDAIFPCFIASIVGVQVTLAWGIHHTAYSVPDGSIPSITAWGLVLSVLAGAIFGIMGMLFAQAAHRLTRLFNSKVSYPPLRPLIGGTMVAAAVWALGTTKYIGLGIQPTVEAFHRPVAPWDFFVKFLFTVLTLGSGYKGGEVTPLFFIGATLGNALAYVIPLSYSLLSAMGFVAVFAGAANIPLAATFMAIEIFGPKVGIYAGIACVASYLFSGHAGIYHSQRLGHRKDIRLL